MVIISWSVSACGSQTLQATAQVVDQAGSASNIRTDTTVVTGEGEASTEQGDDYPDDVDSIGTLTFPVTICGDFHSADNDGQSHTGDSDFIAFVAGSGGTRNFELSWTGVADYDLYLADSDGYIVAWAEGSSSSSPEAFSASLTQDAGYILWAAAWSGVAGEYQIEIQ